MYQVLLLFSDTLSIVARTIGNDVFSPLAAECVQLGLNLTDAIDDPDLRRCTCVTVHYQTKRSRIQRCDRKHILLAFIFHCFVVVFISSGEKLQLTC